MLSDAWSLNVLRGCAVCTGHGFRHVIISAISPHSIEMMTQPRRKWMSRIAHFDFASGNCICRSRSIVNSLVVKPHPDHHGYRNSRWRRVSVRIWGNTEYRPELFSRCRHKGQPSRVRKMNANFHLIAVPQCAQFIGLSPYARHEIARNRALAATNVSTLT